MPVIEPFRASDRVVRVFAVVRFVEVALGVAVGVGAADEGVGEAVVARVLGVFTGDGLFDVVFAVREKAGSRPASEESPDVPHAAITTARQILEMIIVIRFVPILSARIRRVSKHRTFCYGGGYSRICRAVRGGNRDECVYKGESATGCRSWPVRTGRVTGSDG